MCEIIRGSTFAAAGFRDVFHAATLAFGNDSGPPLRELFVTIRRNPLMRKPVIVFRQFGERRVFQRFQVFNPILSRRCDFFRHAWRLLRQPLEGVITPCVGYPGNGRSTPLPYTALRIN